VISAESSEIAMTSISQPRLRVRQKPRMHVTASDEASAINRGGRRLKEGEFMNGATA
jgi:hypothetical protein